MVLRGSARGLEELLHGWHPEGSQMAALEENPVAIFHCCLYSFSLLKAPWPQPREMDLTLINTRHKNTTVTICAQ